MTLWDIALGVVLGVAMLVGIWIGVLIVVAAAYITYLHLDHLYWDYQRKRDG